MQLEIYPETNRQTKLRIYGNVFNIKSAFSPKEIKSRLDKNIPGNINSGAGFQSSGTVEPLVIEQTLIEYASVEILPKIILGSDFTGQMIVSCIINVINGKKILTLQKNNLQSILCQKIHLTK